MGDLVNLRQVKKQRERAAKAAEADARRRQFGRTGAEKDSEAAATRRADQILDQARLDKPQE